MLEVYNTCIELSPIDVEFIMGLRARGLKIDMNKDVINNNNLCKKYYDKKGWLPLVMFENQIREDREGENDFKVRFVLFVLGALLCPVIYFCEMFLFTSCGRQWFNKEDKLDWICVVLSCAQDWRV